MEKQHSENIQSSIAKFEEFVESQIWKDLKSELIVWKEDIQSIQDNVSDEKELFRCQGRKEAINNFLVLPETIIDYLEQKNGK
jgi:hypothetical protein